MPLGERMARSSATLRWRKVLYSRADESTPTTKTAAAIPRHFTDFLIIRHTPAQGSRLDVRPLLEVPSNRVLCHYDDGALREYLRRNACMPLSFQLFQSHRRRQ